MSYSIEKAIASLRNNKNMVSHLYEDAHFSNGPLNGMTSTIKDVFATRNAPTQASSKILENFEPLYDAELVKKLRKSGAAIIAKTHLDELALGGTGMYSAWGPIANPLDETRYVGGSSSGAAATLNSNIAFAIGSDTGDSVRLPASFIGKVGFKPSYGAVSRFGLFSFATSLDTVAWFSHDVKTTIDVAKVLYGKDDKDMTSKDVNIENIVEQKPKIIGALDLSNFCKPYVAKKYDETLAKLKSQDIKIKKIGINQKLMSIITTVYNVISYSEASSNNSNLTGIAFGKRESGDSWEEIMINTRSKNFGPMVQRRFTLGSFYLKDENKIDYFLRAQKVRRLISDMHKELLKNVDLIIFPSTGEIANKLTEPRLDNLMSGILTMANLVGSPSITLPWGVEHSMPFGLQLETSLYEDKKLLEFALWIEKALGGNNE